ncbi:hypothetical protein TR13x_00865 [Caloranaerobacter sp. TR13]|uniref:extracellular solute-binding protein n=1 Tax=Caloranaerobacter sp. TR13 TaxID=1302151 RepID=UPI0006D409BB|nr:extracellular solute-binding protein [Caloranaerobacter sp. TR13]KPU27935.1 hypothetical protein TR13x_00865 [Caloranaerobacter sp. TR13]
MKKALSIIIFILLSISIVSCSIKTDKEVNKKGMNEISIIVRGKYFKNAKMMLERYKYKFEREKGIKVKYEVITASNYDDYIKKVNIKLHEKEGPTLILITSGENYLNFIERGISLDIKNKIPNFEKVYESLKANNNFIVPFGIYSSPIALNRNVLKELNIQEPSLDWTRQDYLEIKEKWLEREPRYFTSEMYKELIWNVLDDLEIIDAKNNKVNVNNKKVIEYIKSLRNEIFSGKYILNKNYTYENYYKMFFVKDSEEYKEAMKLQKYFDSQNLRRIYYKKDALKSLKNDIDMDINDIIVLPQVLYDEMFVQVNGFIVNKNGKNIQLGLEFLNYLLNDENQLEMYRTKSNPYPVNKEIEEKIEEIEKANDVNEKSVELRKYILEQLKNGRYKPFKHQKRIYYDIKKSIISEFTKFIFADEPYTDEELSRELQKLEDKLNMWLNE